MDTSELEDFAKKVLGDSAEKLSQLKREQLERVEAKIAEVARASVESELADLRAQVESLGDRVDALEKRLAAPTS